MVTCKQFLSELSDFLDQSVTGEARRELEEHLNECPNCWVVCDTTKKTIEVYRGMEPYSIPAGVHERLLEALRKKTR